MTKYCSAVYYFNERVCVSKKRDLHNFANVSWIIMAWTKLSDKKKKKMLCF